MFFINIFYTTQEMNKILIKSSYNDVKSIMNNFKNKYPNFKGYIIGDEYNNLNETTKTDWNEYKEKIKESRQILINNLLNYSENYPNEKISKNQFIIDYKEYPYRLNQYVSHVISEL